MEWIYNLQLMNKSDCHIPFFSIIFSLEFRIDKDICIKKNPIFHEARLLSIS